VLVGAHGLYEARCRRCFDPLLRRTKTAEERADVIEPAASDSSKANV